MSNISFNDRWASQSYKKKYVTSIVLVLILLTLMPYGFAIIQNRGGILWNDYILDQLPPADLSIPIFSILYGSGAIVLFRVFQNPHFIYKYIVPYMFITVLRFLLIYLIPLDPPVAMVELADPITKIFYGGTLITRDLFFSGHTSSVFLIYLVLEKKTDKNISLFCTIFMAVFLLIQHVHYTADVLAAFPFTYFIWKFCGIK